jgi:hypothetical protein
MSRLLNFGIGQAATFIAGKIAGLAVGVTLAIKGEVDDWDKARLKEVQDSEGCPHIGSCYEYGKAAGPGITAMKIALNGMTAWKSPSGAWVYHKQPDWLPKFSIEIYRPSADGRFQVEGQTVGRPKTGTHICHECRS